MLKKRDWNETTTQARGCMGCITTVLVSLAIDAAIIALIAWLVRTIIG